MASVKKTVIFSEGLFRGAGSVAVWNRKIINRFVLDVKFSTPVRSGQMKAGWRGYSKTIGPHQVEGYVTNLVEHSGFVIYGTKEDGAGYITARGGTRGYRRTNANGDPVSTGNSRKGGMPLRSFSRTRPNAGWAAAVRGQKAQGSAILGRAWNRTARDHTSIRGKNPFI